MGQFCGFREGVEAHKLAGEPLCEDCRRSVARRARRTAYNASRLRRVDSDDGYVSLDSADLSATFDEHMTSGGFTAD